MLLGRKFEIGIWELRFLKRDPYPLFTNPTIRNQLNINLHNFIWFLSGGGVVFF